MKIRNGFVSNSSSTSFLIVTKEPLTMELLLPKMVKYFSILFGTHVYYKIISRIGVFLFGHEVALDTLPEVYIEEGFIYAYRGTGSVLNQDNWASIENRIINPDIYIHDEDFIMRSDEDKW